MPKSFYWTHFYFFLKFFYKSLETQYTLHNLMTLPSLLHLMVEEMEKRWENKMEYAISQK